MNEIEQAKKTLRDAGYFTDNLWHVDDVKQNYDCDNETALEILDNALTNDKTTEQIFNCIDDIIDNKYRTL